MLRPSERRRRERPWIERLQWTRIQLFDAPLHALRYARPGADFYVRKLAIAGFCRGQRRSVSGRMQTVVRRYLRSNVGVNRQTTAQRLFVWLNDLSALAQISYA